MAAVPVAPASHEKLKHVFICVESFDRAMSPVPAETPGAISNIAMSVAGPSNNNIAVSGGAVPA